MPETAERSVPTRRISFADSLADMPRYFAGDEDLITSHVMAVLSGLFPDGEDFFVRSVRHYRDQISDPELARQVAGFIGQEATHGREHRLLNERLDELGYRTKGVERFTRRGLKARERVFGPKNNLAATAALEHFTATLAELLLSDPDARQRVGDSVLTDVLVWHALEESEHKAVAFDVYRAVGGSERMRVFVMNATTVGFIVTVLMHVASRLLSDRATYQRGRLRRSIGRVRRSPLFRRELWRQLREYNRDGFHPDDRDTTELVEEWRTELFGDEGRFNDRLVGAQAVA